ncbi:TPA: hypothetical protein ACX37U_003990, partial [Serratia marcescens]
IQRLALRGDRAAGRRDGQSCTKPALARVLERSSFFDSVCGDSGVLAAQYAGGGVAEHADIHRAARHFLKSACHISNLRLFLLYGILRRSVSDG